MYPKASREGKYANTVSLYMSLRREFAHRINTAKRRNPKLMTNNSHMKIIEALANHNVSKLGRKEKDMLIMAIKSKTRRIKTEKKKAEYEQILRELE